MIAFDGRGHESIIYRANSCLAPESIPPASANVAIANEEYYISSDNDLEWTLPKSLGFGLDLSSLIGHDGVTRVNFRLLDPSVISIEKGVAKRFINSLDDASCLSMLFEPANLIIHSVLSAEGVEYHFTDQRNRVVNIEPRLEALGSPQLASHSSVSESKGIVLRRKMFFGYKAWKATELSALLLETIELADLSPEQVEQLRVQ